MVGEAIAEFVGEVLIRGIGYAILRYIRPSGRSTLDPDGLPVLIAGLSFWTAVAVGGYLLYGHVSARLHAAT